MPRKITDQWRDKVAEALSRDPSLNAEKACGLLEKANIPFLRKSVSDLLKNLRRKQQGLQSRIEQMEGLHSYKLDQRWLSDVQSLVVENKRLQKELDESRALVETHKAEAEVAAGQRDKLQLKLESIRQLLDPSNAAPEPTMRDLWQEHLDTLR